MVLLYKCCNYIDKQKLFLNKSRVEGRRSRGLRGSRGFSRYPVWTHNPLLSRQAALIIAPGPPPILFYKVFTQNIRLPLTIKFGKLIVTKYFTLILACSKLWQMTKTMLSFGNQGVFSWGSWRLARTTADWSTYFLWSTYFHCWGVLYFDRSTATASFWLRALTCCVSIHLHHIISLVQ